MCWNRFLLNCLFRNWRIHVALHLIILLNISTRFYLLWIHLFCSCADSHFSSSCTCHADTVLKAWQRNPNISHFSRFHFYSNSICSRSFGSLEWAYCHWTFFHSGTIPSSDLTFFLFFLSVNTKKVCTWSNQCHFFFFRYQRTRIPCKVDGTSLLVAQTSLFLLDELRWKLLIFRNHDYGVVNTKEN